MPARRLLRRCAPRNDNLFRHCERSEAISMQLREWSDAMAGALDGVRVLELARYQAGPRGGMILSDLGAEVIKIEKLGGEETRKSEPIVRGQSVYFTVYNRGKKSLCLDMRTERGKEIFAALVPTADIVLQNFRPGVMEKMGFGYEQLRKLKKDIDRK